MAQINYIKDLYEKEGLSLREISRRTGKDFRTVRKYAYQENWNPPVKKLEAEEFPVMGKYIPIVNRWLEDDEREPRKQWHSVSGYITACKKNTDIPLATAALNGMSG